MTEGNQGHAWDRAKADLKRDPNNPTLKTAEAVAREKYNSSMRKSGQKER